MSKSGIEWTDETWNPVTGCTKVSQGCKHCYAERVWQRLSAPRQPYAGRKFTDVQCHYERLEHPLHWKKPRMVFVNSMSDLFHEDVPDYFISRVFLEMSRCPQHTFQILTKRHERMLAYMNGVLKSAKIRVANGYPTKFWPLPNVWLGVSVEDQATADERIPLLLQTPAAVRFVSVEPMLGPIDLNKRVCLVDKRRFKLTIGNYLDWVICGGESGPKARPMHPDWARSLCDQCKAAGVPFFFKQWGEWAPIDLWSPGPAKQNAVMPDGTWCSIHINPDDVGAHRMINCGKKAAGRLLDGREWNEMPEQGERDRVRRCPGG